MVQRKPEQIARVQLEKREVRVSDPHSGYQPRAEPQPTFSAVQAKRRQRMLGTVPEEGHCVMCTKVVNDYEQKVTLRLDLYVCSECMALRPVASEAAMALLRSLRTQDRDLLSVTARATGSSYEWWSQKLQEIREREG